MAKKDIKPVEPHFVKRGSLVANPEYAQWLSDLKTRLHHSQIKAAVRVNTSLLEFYWNLGKDIVTLQVESSWGSGFFNRLSLDLREAFPLMKGLSVTNIKYAKRWYMFYSQLHTNGQQLIGESGQPIRHQLGDELQLPPTFALVPWRHHIEIMAKSKTVNEALFYIDQVTANNWSRATLTQMMSSHLYERQGKAITNFDEHLPLPQAELAQEILKDPYNFDFLTMREPYDERVLEEALEHNIRRFLLELGTGFAYIGRQMELRMPGGQSYFPDMVFYHTKLKCYVVVELKVVEFKPEFAGKLNFYVSAANHLLKDESDNPSIGLLICKSKDDTVVKWAFEGIDRPMGVATYELDEVMRKTIAEKLPTIEEIERELGKE